MASAINRKNSCTKLLLLQTHKFHFINLTVPSVTPIFPWHFSRNGFRLFRTSGGGHYGNTNMHTLIGIFIIVSIGTVNTLSSRRTSPALTALSANIVAAVRTMLLEDISVNAQ